MVSNGSTAFVLTFLAMFETEHVYQYQQQILLWRRFIHNLVCIWLHGEEEVHKCCNLLNSKHQRINFNRSHSTGHIEFHNNTFHCEQTGTLITTLYC